MKLYKLNKAVLSIKNKPATFLNGITSNTLNQPKNAFLDLHGKIIATFDQFKISDDEFLVIIERPFLEELLKHLDKFVRLSKAQVKTRDLNVYYDISGEYQVREGEFALPQKQGKLVITSQDMKAAVSDEEFTRFRLEHHIPLQGIDYRHELLLNVDEDSFVSYTKGCFLGQEPISKVHSRSKPTWKLMVKYEDECSPELKAKMTSQIKDAGSQRTKGFVFVRNQ